MPFFEAPTNLFRTGRTQFTSSKAHKCSMRAFTPEVAEEALFDVVFMTKDSHPHHLQLLTANFHDFVRLQRLLLANQIPAEHLTRSAAEYVFSQYEPDFRYNITLSSSEEIELVKKIFNKEYTLEELNSASFQLPERYLTGLRNVTPDLEYPNEAPKTPNAPEQKNETPAAVGTGMKPHTLSIFKPSLDGTLSIGGSEVNEISEKGNNNAWWRVL